MMNLVNINRVNKWVSGTYKGIGFSMKNGWLEIGRVDELGIEMETRIRKEILNMLRLELGRNESVTRK